jgi:N-hydroxyarylamine O-acetyltransferase
MIGTALSGATRTSFGAMNLSAYLARLGIASEPKGADLTTLATIMEAHSRAITFENCDVVQNKNISITREDVERKLVGDCRGGYCFEQNTLLQMALEALGFDVTPLLCRVRWSKPDDSAGANTTYTHMALKVKLQTGDYLADVGFAGTNSIAPVALGTAEPQSLPEGQFRVADGRPGYNSLELLVKGEWRPLYTWRDEVAPVVDLECSNWYSCTFPKARFTTSFFVCRVIEGERHHILNENYVVRGGHGVESVVQSSPIRDMAHLLELLETVFGLRLPADTAGLDRYLPCAKS